jgi:hypothetical protein
MDAHRRHQLARCCTTSKNCPLPTPEDRLLFMLIYLQQRPTQLLHGRLFGMRPSKATPWIHVLQPVLCHTLRSLGDAPCRSAGALRERLGVEAPLLPLEAPHAEEVRAPRTRLHRTGVIAARTRGTC